MDSQNERTIPAAIARVVDATVNGEPQVLDVDGVLYRRENDQEDARRELEQEQRWARVRAYGVPQKLLTDIDLHIGSVFVDEQAECMRRIGYLLVFHGQHDIWRLAYLEYVRGSQYVIGDETLFLLHLPTSGQEGYTGPHPSRLNTALEQASQTRRHKRASASED